MFFRMIREPVIYQALDLKLFGPEIEQQSQPVAGRFQIAERLNEILVA